LFNAHKHVLLQLPDEYNFPVMHPLSSFRAKWKVFWSESSKFVPDHEGIWERGWKVKISLYRQWEPFTLREVEAPTFSDIRLIDGGKTLSSTRRPLLPPGRILVPISVRGWVDPMAIVRLEKSGKLKISTSSGIRTGDLPACRYCLNQLRYRVSPDDVEKRKFLPSPRLELQHLGRPTRSQSLYRLRYSGSSS
jgi:hypothetical protein